MPWLTEKRGCLSSSSSELRLLHLNKFTIVRWIEVEKRSTRSKMLHKNLSDHPGAARGHRWHGQCANRGRATTVLKVVNGKIVEEIGLDDGVTALTQLGLLKAA